jgi:succinate dehydrogenase/fumarate reductase flavoprotein subunit
MTAAKEREISADVLVIGGGMAGGFAAIKASEQGCDVVLVDKGYVSKSGETPYAGDTVVFNEAWGHDLDAWLEQVSVVGEYLNDRRWNEIVFRESYERFQDLRSWGVQFLEEDGEPVRLDHPLTQITLPDQDKFPPLVSQVVHWLPGFPTAIRKQVVRSGVRIIDRFVVTELLQHDDGVCGAVGFDVEGAEPRVIRAKATVMCAGGGGFKPVGYPTHELTGDGHVLAYRAGATITGKEFLSPHHTDPEHPAWPPMYLFFSSGHSAALPGMWRDERMVNAEGDEVPLRGMAWHGWIDAEWEAHEGRAPVVMESRRDGTERRISGPGGHGSMLGHAAGGIVPVDDSCATHVAGLFAAGDSCGTCFVGAAYSGFGFATMHAAVTGARAGLGAAQYALDVEDAAPAADVVAAATERLRAPLERTGGFTPHWVTQVLQNALAPYFVLYVKEESRMRAALTIVEFLRDHVVPKLFARDDHELRLAHETANMVANAEMKLRASLFRTESRGTHYREDHPRRGDPEWLAWVRLKDEDGRMTPFTEPVPAEWRPDPESPNEERYPMRLPGEAGAAAPDAGGRPGRE